MNKELHPIEVVLRLMEQPLADAVAIMLEGLKTQNIIEVLSQDPLQIRILSARSSPGRV